MTKIKFLGKNNHGFTLAETLVSMVIFLLIILIVGNTFIINQKITRQSDTKAELMQNGRIVSDLMAREIRQAKSIVTVLPADNSNPAAVAHELQFQDGHVSSQIQYIRYYLTGTNLNRQIIVYYFDASPNAYVYCNDHDAFGLPKQKILEDKLIGENFSDIDFYGQGLININYILTKNNMAVGLTSVIKPRNI